MKFNESVVAQKTRYKNSSTSIDFLDWVCMAFRWKNYDNSPSPKIHPLVSSAILAHWLSFRFKVGVNANLSEILRGLKKG